MAAEQDWEVLSQLKRIAPGQATMMSCTLRVSNNLDGREVTGGYAWPRKEPHREAAARDYFFRVQLKESGGDDGR